MWERLHYDWSDPNRVVVTDTDSNTWAGRSGYVYTLTRRPDGLTDVFHVAAQGVIAGANLVLTDVHPQPKNALVDAAQALTLEELPGFIEDCAIAREAYEKRVAARRARVA